MSYSLFESLVNSSSGKTFLSVFVYQVCLRALLIQVVVKHLCYDYNAKKGLRALLIQVVVKQKEEGVFVPTV